MSEVLKLVKKRFFIDRTTGLPVTWAKGMEHERLDLPNSPLKAICVSPNLNNPTTFYMVQKGEKGLVVTMSDGTETVHMYLSLEDEINKVQLRLHASCRSLQAASANFIRLQNVNNSTPMQWMKIKMRNLVHMPVLHTFTR